MSLSSLSKLGGEEGEAGGEAREEEVEEEKLRESPLIIGDLPTV